MTSVQITWLRGRGRVRLTVLRPAELRRWRAYQTLTPDKTMKPVNAMTENQLRLSWPRGMTMKAASSGPIAVPVLPPT